MSEDKPISRRDFLKLGGKALVSAPVVSAFGSGSNSEVKTEAEQVGLVEGMKRPTKLIDQLVENIEKRNVEEGEYFSVFLQNYSEEHSTDPAMARRNRDALDYAFGERHLGERIIGVVDDELKLYYPGLEIEERLKHSHAGENEALHSVVTVFRTMEGISRVDISKADGERLMDGLNNILDWVKPMSSLEDYSAEKAIYAHRAQELIDKNRLYENTYRAWEGTGPQIQEAILQLLSVEDKYFPVVGAASAVLNLGEGAGNNPKTQEIILSPALPDGIKEKNAYYVEIGLTELIHEQSHQFQRNSLEFSLLPVLHPEDLVEDYEVRNNLLNKFRHKVAEMDYKDIADFASDPGHTIEFSRRRYYPIIEESHGRLVTEMYGIGGVLSYIQGEEFKDDADAQAFLAENSSLNVDSVTRDIQLIRDAKHNPELVPQVEALYETHSANMLACYALLTKMHASNTLIEHEGLFSNYPQFIEVVEGEMLHATQGPPGQYLATPTSESNITDSPKEAMERIKKEAQEIRQSSSYESTNKSVELVEFLYDQVVARMGVQARLWGGTGNEDYSAFALEVIDELV